MAAWSLVRRLALAVAMAACAAGASCTRYDTATEEYIGPLTPPKEGETTPGVGKTEEKAPPLPGKVPQIPAEGPIKVSLSEAIVLALANNQSLVVDRMNVPIARTFEEQERAVFDPDVTASLSRERRDFLNVARSAFVEGLAQTWNWQAGVTQRLPTGTTLGLNLTTAVNHGAFGGEDLFTSNVEFTVTQSLLRGFGPDVNLARLREARLNTLTSQYELRGFAEALVGSVENTYWDYALAQRQIEIFTQSLEVAEQQLRETNERIRVGKLAELDRAAAEAEVALRRELLINGRSTLAKTRLTFLQLLNPTKAAYWTRDVQVPTLPTAPEVKLEDVESHVQLAMRMRPDLNQARLQVQRGDLEVVRTKNGLLPQLDLFASLARTGYGNAYSRSVRGVFRDQGYDMLVGVNFEYPPINRSARAQFSFAALTRKQLAESVTNLEQLAEVSVRSAYVEVERAREQVAATAVTRRLQEETLRAEQEKFRVGKSTTLLVAQAQRDLLSSQIAEVQAVVAYLEAFVNLYQLEGSLLARRGIAAPGREPVAMPPERLP